MSLDGLMTARGSRVTVRKSTEARAADNSVSLSWADRVTGLHALHEPVTAIEAQRIWGLEEQVDVRALYPWGSGIQGGDGVIVTTGWDMPDHYRVVGVLPRPIGVRHLEVALQKTQETFA